VEELLRSGLEQNPSGAAAIGYREVRAMLRGELKPELLADEIAKNTRALVKKQRTWFRTQLPAHPQLEAAACRPQELFSDHPL
jgi:tRNA dimethylallyltransferase